MAWRQAIAGCGLWLVLLPACDCGGPPPAGVDAATRRYDAGFPDGWLPDAEVADLVPVDAAAPDHRVPDGATSDASGGDAVAGDAGGGDAGGGDASDPDAARRDAVPPDMAAGDLVSADAGCSSTCAVAGATRCQGNAVITCEPQGDCLGWSAPVACGGDTSCSDGRCRSVCSDECTVTGAVRCQSQTVVESCGQFDQDTCLEWGGALGCQANAWRSCGNHDLDACLEWSTATTCPAGTVCSGGVCALTCTDECGPAGSVACAGTGTRHCGNYDLDPCLDWSDVTPCQIGTTCSGGVCQPSCSDECSGGQQQCASGTTLQACATNFDADACWDWGPPLVCPLASPFCQEPTPGQAACVAGCSDACNLAAPVACHDGQSTIACVTGSAGCSEWRITPCGGDQACMGDACVTCLADALEVNDSAAQARLLPGLPYTSATLTLCAPDEDWFAVDLAAGQTLDVTLRFSHALGDVDLHVMDASQQNVVRSISLSDDEHARFYSASGGRVLIRVFGFLGDSNTYTLKLALATCTDDAYEVNDDLAHATPLASAPSSLTDLELCPGDEDWYTFTPTAGQNVQVDLTFAHTLGNLDLTVYDSALGLLAFGWSGTDNERVTIFNTVAEPYYLLVDTIGQLSNSYGLSLTTVAGCSADPLEANDSSTAATVVLGLPLQRDDLTLCGSDQDWFKVTALAGDSMRFEIAFLHAQADLDLELFDASLQSVATSKSVDDDELITVTGMAAQSYYLKVSASDLRASPYHLRISRP